MPYTKIKSKRIKDLNVKQETMKILEKIGRKPFYVNQSNIFWICPPGKENNSKNKQIRLN